MNRINCFYDSFYNMNDSKRKYFVNEIIGTVARKTNKYKKFSNLTEKEQIEFIMMVIENYQDKEIVNSLYDYVKSTGLLKIYEKERNTEEMGRISKILDIISRKCSNLSSENKKEVFDDLKSCYNDIINRPSKECDHKYGSWETVHTTKFVTPSSIDRGCISRNCDKRCVEIPYTFFRRECKKCGYIEIVNTEPEEVKINRENEEKQKKIEFYKREIKRLENE